MLHRYPAEVSWEIQVQQRVLATNQHQKLNFRHLTEISVYYWYRKVVNFDSPAKVDTILPVHKIQCWNYPKRKFGLETNPTTSFAVLLSSPATHAIPGDERNPSELKGITLICTYSSRQDINAWMEAVTFPPRNYALSQSRARVETCTKPTFTSFRLPAGVSRYPQFKVLILWSTTCIRMIYCGYFWTRKYAIYSKLFGKRRSVSAQSVSFMGVVLSVASPLIVLTSPKKRFWSLVALCVIRVWNSEHNESLKENSLSNIVFSSKNTTSTLDDGIVVAFCASSQFKENRQVPKWHILWENPQRRGYSGGCVAF